MRDYNLSDILVALLSGFILGLIVAFIFNILLSINRSSDTRLLCGIVSDNNISNSTVTMVCKEYPK